MKRPSLTVLISAGLVLGLAWGLFFGEDGAGIKWIGDVYVGLLQMTVLPYIGLALTCNIGRLSAGQGGRLVRVSFLTMALLWVVGLLTLIVMRFSFPAWDGGSFYTASIVEKPANPDWLRLFIPSNPFWSLTHNLVPAVVVFSIGLGIAIVPISNKEVLLEKVDVLIEGFSRLNKLIVRTTPIGIFAVVGHTAGTISLEQFALLQGYLLVYGAAALLLSLWILPALIACLTPFSQREVLAASRDAMLTAFVIGNTFVVLPMIIESVKQLMEKHRLALADTSHTPDFSVQLAYPFPDIGRIVSIVFLPFAAWFYGMQIDYSVVPQLLGTGFVGAFAKPIVTIPLLLDLAEIPADVFNLFLAVGAIAGRFGDLMKVMHLFTFAILTACYLSGTARLDLTRSLTRGLTTAIVLAVTVVSIRTYLIRSFQDRYSRERLVTARQLLGTPVPAKILERSEPAPVPLLEGEDRMDRISRRGLIRIGVDTDRMPFAYFNEDRRLVGFDIDMAHQLARDLEVSIEFVPFSGDIIEPLRGDHFDVAMSGLEGTIKRARELPDMESYMEVTRAMIVPDSRRGQFSSLRRMAKELSGRDPLRVGIVAGSIQSELTSIDQGLGTGAGAVKRLGLMGNVKIVTLVNESEFFESRPPVADILMTSAEQGSAWTLKYPHYSVAKPEGWDARSSLTYFVPEESRFEEFMSGWLKLKKLNGTVQQLYDYWILGVDPKASPPRWCINRDVLGWVD
ncbi:cation:dicarboxylase symporter family transporter [Stieleria sp. ICT_E10.1]|uniref:cation:dicarboxylate symporter family transporter n=1 Tax=Stieleria sedimenti TaxID=2976331 RepID=UPI0021809774|nr:cation:dicarboxylase symporter family transporter [Stieleria sedimenti]MCS7467355.1 cation:dicarboxylase symporter family transporter [Stieleria sedimenti]